MELKDKIRACQHVLTNLEHLVGDRIDRLIEGLEEDTYGFDPYLTKEELEYIIKLVKNTWQSTNNLI